MIVNTPPEDLCPGCFADKGDANPCPHCGYDEEEERSPLLLPHRTVLNGQFLIGRVLGKPGGFGITYLGWDLKLATCVAIKEYLPRDLAGRAADQATIAPHSVDDRALFRYGLGRFLDEARTLAKLDHPNIVRVRQFFEANGTAYLVMDYYAGISLAERLQQQGGRLDEAATKELLLPILSGLRAVHDKGFLHRDIKPQNIYLARTDGDGVRPILLDFGAARQAMGERSRSLSVVVTPGYAPFEQYHTRGQQGPWTDLYAVAAVIYRCVTGELLPESTNRVAGDTLKPASKFGASKGLSDVLARALSVSPEDRPQSAMALHDQLRGVGQSPGLNRSEPVAPLPNDAETREDRQRQPFRSESDHEPATLPTSSERQGEALPGRGETIDSAILDNLETVDSSPSPSPPISSSPSSPPPRGALPGRGETIDSAILDNLETVVSSPPPPSSSPSSPPPPPGRRWLLPAGLGAILLVLAGAGWLAWRTPPQDHGDTDQDEGQGQGQGQGQDRPVTAREPIVPEFVRIEGGCFAMGSPGSEAGRDPDERAHRVCVADFALGRHEVTVGELRRFVEATGYRTDAERGTGGEAGCWAIDREDELSLWDWRAWASWREPIREDTISDAHPVTCISWLDAQHYIDWLNKETGERYRLPTEAEWEYAARAGTTTARFWGSNPTEACRYANVADLTSLTGGIARSDLHACTDGFAFTSPVGHFDDNPWALKDVLGNVWELTCSRWDPDYTGAEEHCADPSHAGYIVVRGGSWNDLPGHVRAAMRNYGAPSYRSNDRGFRLARD